MSRSNPLILRVHLDGARPYEIGDEIWQQPLAEAIRTEAETIADNAGPGLLPLPGRAGRVALRNHVLKEMTAALRRAGDTYIAPDGIAYTLTDSAQLDLPAPDDTLAPVGPAQPAPIVEAVLRFEDLPLGSSATRAAVVRWSDGTESRALAWYGDLCGHPHKSLYAESRVMSTWPPRSSASRGTARKARHNQSASLRREVARFEWMRGLEVRLMS